MGCQTGLGRSKGLQSLSGNLQRVVQQGLRSKSSRILGNGRFHVRICPRRAHGCILYACPNSGCRVTNTAQITERALVNDQVADGTASE